MPISGWAMYGIELLIIGSQCNILLRISSFFFLFFFWYRTVYICRTSVVPHAAMRLLAQLLMLLCA